MCDAFIQIINYLMHYYINAFEQYATFSGRASRKDFWTFALINLIVALMFGFIGGLFAGLTHLSFFNYLAHLYALCALVPGLAISVRRLHDTDHSGWWYFISFIPLIGFIWLLVLFVLDSTPGTNIYGVNPKGIDVSAPTPTAAQRPTPLVAPSAPAPVATEPTEPPAVIPGARIGE